MPDLSITEALIAIAATIGGSAATGVAVSRRRPLPGTPEDHERRLGEGEANIAALAARITTLETRMSTTEKTLADAIGRHAESTERLWRCVEKLDESTDKLRETVIGLDVESRIEREQRNEERRRALTNPGGG